LAPSAESITTDAADRRHMRAALALARRGLGSTWPNPAVGCVLVRPDLEGRVVGRGWTHPGGRPHAETEALRRAGELARGAVAYVTLEPCAHHGRTPPCAEALAAAGVVRVVSAVEDPDPRVAGRGLAMLRRTGIAVSEGVCAAEARDVNAGFFLRVLQGRPLVTLKAATSLDGRIASASGESRWITGVEARAWGHRLRATHDVVLVGIGTALADDPALTCRLPGLGNRRPLRVVADTKLRLKTSSQLARTARDHPVIVYAAEGSGEKRRTLLEAAGVRVLLAATGEEGRVLPAAILHSLAEMGITRVLLEGGGTLAAAFLDAEIGRASCRERV
jgi:diaminohydroxyphosphoribosylaminopyrimidine deaminase/5-amino-6-(5-phosphoribosylamino)uracil reductase